VATRTCTYVAMANNSRCPSNTTQATSITAFFLQLAVDRDSVALDCSVTEPAVSAAPVATPE